MRMSLYDDSGGYPNSLIVAETEVTTMATTGFKEQDINLFLPMGFYWGACVFSSTPTVQGDAQQNPWLGKTSATDIVEYSGIAVAHAYAALPSTFTAGGTLQAATLPRVLMIVGKDADLP
jgi:hypothetical protein